MCSAVNAELTLLPQLKCTGCQLTCSVTPTHDLSSLGAMVSVRPGARSGHPGSVKSSEQQNSQGKGPFELKCMEETATLLRNITRQVPAPEAIKP